VKKDKKKRMKIGNSAENPALPFAAFLVSSRLAGAFSGEFNGVLMQGYLPV
jgi:hypothetical protein